MSVSNTRLYSVWKHMVDRCHRSADYNYRGYGGRGISVCSEWKNSVRVFILWAETHGYHETLQLDRRNNNGNYTPENCRFVSASVNQSNKNKSTANTSGYIGVCFHQGSGMYHATITVNKKRIYIAATYSALTAAIKRDRYVRVNKLPHTLNFISEKQEIRYAKLNRG